jgi:hypothetical protein
MKNEKFYSQMSTNLKHRRDLGTRGLSDCVEASWRD